MRRARISIKPNVRPGGRSVAPVSEDKSSERSTAVDDTQQTPPQSQLDVRESAVPTGDGNVPGCPSEKASLNTNDGAPSSASTPATTALQRRSRFSITPNLARPKVHSAPPSSSGKTASLLSGPSKTSSPVQSAKSFPQSPVPVAVSRDDSQNSTFSNATTEANCPPSSPCLPSTFECPEASSSTPSQQEPHQTPQKMPIKDSEPQEGATPASCTRSPHVKLTRVDGPDSPLWNKMSSDQQQVLRALKLKELMKLERKKQRMERKSRLRKREHCIELDRDKMSLADFIYYLPESNPMKSSFSTEETQAQTTAPPLITVQKSMAETDDDNGDAEDAVLVPKVRVAEDGSLILDEESLTVRVQRTSDTIVENANPLFERGSTTTYSSFRKNTYVKSWSVRETDMFYLAISMVGTDFSLMAQLLTHRTRGEIKRKFRKEERANAWRVDKAFRNKRPYDAEFFSFLLKRILAKDKQKGKSIKLVVKSSKAKKGKGGKKAKQLEDSINDDEELCSVDSVCFDLEKENEDSCNVNEADVPSSTSKKRKRTKGTKPNVLSCEKTRKPRKTPKKGKCPVEGEDGDLLSVDNDLVEGSSVNVDNEDQSFIPVSKKKRKQSKKGEQEGQEEKTEAKEKFQKKRSKKKLKERNEEATDGETGAANEQQNEVSPIPTKKRKRSKESAKEEETTKRKRKTKKSKTSTEECTGSDLGADGSKVLTADPDAEEDQGEKLSLESTAQEEISQSSSKRSKRPLPNLAKRKAKKCSEPKATEKIQETVEEPQDESCKEAENAFSICLAEEQLQKRPVVVLERTPPRLKDSHSSFESQDQPQSSQTPLHSPGRQTRAEKVKRNLTALDDCSEVSTPGLCAEENQRETCSLESTATEEISQSSSKCSPGRQTRAEKVKHNLTALDDCSEVSTPGLCAEENQRETCSLESTATEEISQSSSKCSPGRQTRVEKRDLTASEGERLDQCQTGSDTSPEDISSTAMPYQVVIQDPKEMETDQHMEEGLNLPHLEFLTSSDVNGQTILKRPVVLVSHEEVQQYLRIKAQTTAEESTASRGDHVQDDASTIDDLPSLASVATFPRPSKTVEKEISSFPAPQVPDTTASDRDMTERRTELEKSPSQISENEDQTTDREEHDSEPSESDVTSDTMIEEPQTELKRIVPVSCSTDGSSVCAQDSVAPEKCSQFSKPTANLGWASQVMINPQQTSKPNEEDKLAVSEVDLQEREQDEDLISPILLLGSTETSDVSVDSTGKGNEEQIDPVPNDVSSEPFEAHSPASSFYDPPTEHTSNMCDMDTILCSESTALNVQIPDEQDSEKQDGTEEGSEAPEGCIATLDENAKSEISGSAGVETQATDDQSEAEPTFILTLYEIPISQLFHEADCDQQDIPPYELRPAQVQTPSLSTGSSQSLSFKLETSSASLHMESEETKKQCKSVSHKVLDDSLVPLSKDAAEDASTQLTSSQESSHDDVNFLISPPEMLSCNLAMPTDAPKLDEIPTKSPETKAPTQRRSKIKVKPKLKPCVRIGPSKNGQHDCAPHQNLLTSQAEIESNHETTAQETVSPKIHLSHKDNERGPHPGYDGVKSITIVPGSEETRDESPVKWESPLRTVLQMDQDSVVDPPVHRVLADAFVLSSGEMEDIFNKEKESPHDSELQKPEELSVYLPDSVRSLSPAVDQKEKMADISKKPDTCREASSVSSVSQEKTVPLQRRGRLQVKPKIPKTTSTKDDFSRQEQTDIVSNEPATSQIISPVPLIKEESVKVEQRSQREDFSDIPKEELDAEDTEGVMNTKQQKPFSTMKPSEFSESSPIELKIEGGHEDVSHVVLSDILVPVSVEMEANVHMESGSPVQSSLLMGEESQQVLAAEADQETHSREGVSHMLLTDIFTPVCEGMQDDLSEECLTTGKKSPHEADKSQMREDPDNADLLGAVSQSSNIGPSILPIKKRPTQGKGKVLVKIPFPKRKAGDSPKSGEQSQTVSPSTFMSKPEVDATLNSPETESVSEPQSTQCSFDTFTCSDLLPVAAEDNEVTCGGISHMVFSDILVPVLDGTAEHIKVEKSTDIEKPPNTETDEPTASQSVSEEWKTPFCMRGTLHPKPKLSKKRDDPSETDFCESGSTQTSSATPQQSLDPQAGEWSLKSNMLPMDSDEIENWCEGVSHMLLSDAFVPVSEEIGENSTDLKVFVSSSPHEDEEQALSRPKSEEMSSEISDEVHQSNMPKMEESNESLSASPAKKSPARSTFQMTLRSPERRLKDQPNVRKTPQRAQTSKMESMGTPTKQHTGEISDVCRVQLERLSVEEIRSAQNVLQPKYHSTPVTVKTTSKGNVMLKASLALHGSRSPGLESHADEEPTMQPGYSPKVVLHRIPVTDANTSTPTSSPARVSTTASRPPADHQFSQNSPPISSLDDKDPVQVSQFFLEDIFTEVVDPD